MPPRSGHRSLSTGCPLGPISRTLSATSVPPPTPRTGALSLHAPLRPARRSCAPRSNGGGRRGAWQCGRPGLWQTRGDRGAVPPCPQARGVHRAGDEAEVAEGLTALQRSRRPLFLACTQTHATRQKPGKGHSQEPGPHARDFPRGLLTEQGSLGLLPEQGRLGLLTEEGRLGRGVVSMPPQPLGTASGRSICYVLLHAASRMPLLEAGVPPRRLPGRRGAAARRPSGQRQHPAATPGMRRRPHRSGCVCCR